MNDPMAVKLLYSDNKVAELLSEYQRTGNYRLRDAVVEHMRPLVQSVARKFAGKEPLEDLESEGYVGLIRAVDRFVPGRGARFSTFATHLVAGQIRHYLRDRGHLIRQPAWLQELNAKVQRAAAELEQKLHRPPTSAEIAEATNLSEEGVEELLTARQAAQIVRMETADADDDDYLVVDPEKFRTRSYVTLQLPIEDRIVLEGALDKLKELEKKVLYAFFFQDNNQSEIARKLGISCNYTGYVLRRGLKHMRERLPDSGALGALAHSGDDEESVLDSLSGVYTQDYWEKRVGEELSRSSRSKDFFSICILRFPRDAGEALLQSAVSALRERTRKADIMGRVGPYEIGVIFPSTGSVAKRVAQRLGEQLAGDLGTTITVDAATYPEDGRSVEALLDAVRPEPREAALPALPRAMALV
jgi:RNA polymerase sigma-B factor